MTDVSLSLFLETHPKARLVALRQHFGVSLTAGATRDTQVLRLAEPKQILLRSLFERMKRDERGRTRNIKFGVLTWEPLFAQSLERQWFNLVSANVGVRWGGRHGDSL